MLNFAKRNTVVWRYMYGAYVRRYVWKTTDSGAHTSARCHVVSTR